MKLEKASKQDNVGFTAPLCSYVVNKLTSPVTRCNRTMSMLKPYEADAIDIKGKKFKQSFGFGWVCSNPKHKNSRVSIGY